MTKTILMKLSLVALTGMLFASAIGCETTEGAGRDIQKAGDGIERAAERNK